MCKRFTRRDDGGTVFEERVPSWRRLVDLGHHLGARWMLKEYPKRPVQHKINMSGTSGTVFEERVLHLLIFGTIMAPTGYKQTLVCESEISH